MLQFILRHRVCKTVITDWELRLQSVAVDLPCVSQTDLEDQANELRHAEDQAKKAMSDAARMADELRQEQDHAAQIDKMRRALELQVFYYCPWPSVFCTVLVLYISLFVARLCRVRKHTCMYCSCSDALNSVVPSGPHAQVYCRRLFRSSALRSVHGWPQSSGGESHG